MAKKDAVSKRLAREIAFAEFLQRVPFFPVEELPAPASEELPWLLQLGDPWPASGDPGEPAPLGLGSYARGASERPILDAFKAFGLDHRRIDDWRALVSHLARVLFPTPRPPGAPRKWTEERMCRLLADVAAYKRRNPEASDVAICNWLAKKSSTEPGTLRRVLQEARNPVRNRLLAETALELVTPQMLEAARATGVDEKKLRSRLIWWVIQNADELWEH